MTEVREVLASADAPSGLYSRPIALHAGTWANHIQPNKANVTVDAITAVINDVHEVYEEHGNKDRHFLMNPQVTSSSGKPLTVIVDPLSNGEHVPVCTAFFNRQPKIGLLVWSKTVTEPNIRSSYDQNSDILYIAVGDFRSEEDDFLENGVMLGYEENGAEPKAATILRFSSRPQEDRRRLADRLAALFHVAPNEIGAALQVN